MDDPNTRPITVAYYDGAVAFGGALAVLSMLFACLDRGQVRPRLISATPQAALERKFATDDIALARVPALSYVNQSAYLNRFGKRSLWRRRLASYTYSLAALITNAPTTLAVFRTLKRERPAVLHVNNSATPLLMALLLGIPVIWHIHEIPQRPGLVEGWLMRSVSKYIAISQYVAHAAIAAGYPRERITVIPNPAPKTENPGLPKKPIRESGLIIAHVGRLIRWKGQLEFLAALVPVVARHPDVTALVVGGDAEHFDSDYAVELQNFVTHNGLTGTVQFTGQVEDILGLMADADIVVHSSIEPEPFGLVIIEAMSIGTPVIAAQSGAPCEIIKDGCNGLLVDPYNTAAFAAALNTMLEQPELRQRLAETALNTVQHDFDANRYAEKLTTLYHSLSAST